MCSTVSVPVLRAVMLSSQGGQGLPRGGGRYLTRALHRHMRVGTVCHTKQLRVRFLFAPLQSEPQNSEHEVARASSSPYACDELDSITVMHACFLQILVRRCRHRPPPAACQWGMPPKKRLRLCMHQRKPGAAAGKNASKPKEKSKSGTFYGRHKADFQKAAGEPLPEEQTR